MPRGVGATAFLFIAAVVLGAGLALPATSWLLVALGALGLLAGDTRRQWRSGHLPRRMHRKAREAAEHIGWLRQVKRPGGRHRAEDRQCPCHQEDGVDRG